MSDAPKGYPVILNGDHAEFEAEHANTPPEDRPDWPLPSFDARDWAKAFVKRHGGDAMPAEQAAALLDEMHSWFANALMRGYDEGTALTPASPPPARQKG